MPKPSKSNADTKGNKPVLQPGEELDVDATSSTIVDELLHLFDLMRDREISGQKAAKIHEELRAAGKIVGQEVKRQTAEIEAAKQVLRLVKRRR